MGWCKANFAACVRLNTPSRRIAYIRVTFGSGKYMWHFLTAPDIFPSSFP